MIMSSLGGLFWTYIYPTIASWLYRLIDLAPRSSHVYRWKTARKKVDATPPFVPNHQKHILFFCPSLGEYESIVSVISSLKANDAPPYIEVSFFSVSGYTPLQGAIEHQVDHISYSPTDTKKLTQEFFSQRQLDHVIISTLAIWPTFLEHIWEKNISYSFIAVRVRQGLFKQTYYKCLSKYLKRADHIMTIDDSDQKILEGVLKDINISTLGDPRVDSIISQLEQKREDEITMQFFAQQSGSNRKIIFASTHAEDEAILMPILESLIDKGCLIAIAPHHPERSEGLKNELSSRGFSSTYHSSYDEGHQILLVDKIGVLKHLYQYCDLAYVGGGFKDGLHNIAEPLFSNCHTIVGPKISNSYIAQKLETSNVLDIIRDSDELRSVILNCKINNSITTSVTTALTDHIGSSEQIKNMIFTSNKK